MIVLGISPLDKDATVSLVANGKVLFAAGEERLTRDKCKTFSGGGAAGGNTLFLCEDYKDHDRRFYKTVLVRKELGRPFWKRIPKQPVQTR